MVSKLSWILFLPLTIAAAFCKLAQTMLPDNALLGLSDMMLDYVVIGCVVLVFLFTLIMCLCDRKISNYYLSHRNIPAGIIGILLALLLAADGADQIYSLIGSDKLDVMAILEAAMLIFAAIVFVVMGLSHSFSNKSEKKAMGLLYIAPALLCAIRLIRCFIEFTTISITLADVTRLFCYIFATMFFFNYAVTLSLTEAKHTVKSCFIYGFPAAAALLSYAAGALYAGFDTNNIMNNAHNVEVALLGLYVLCFLIELTIFAKDKDHVRIVDDADYRSIDDDTLENSSDLVVGGLSDSERSDDPASSYLSTADTKSYLYQVEKDENNRESSYFKAAEHDLNDFITDEVPSDYEKDGKTTKSYTDQLDEIDKLILEISGDK